MLPSALRLRHLNVFLAVARCGSMQHASRDIHLTQPAISKLIAELEGIFGAQLFERSKRGVALTECGKALVDRTELILNDLTSAKQEIEAIARGAIGCVRVGVLPVAEASILPSTLLTLRKVAPKLSVQVEEGTRAALVNSLRRGEIDCVIGRLDVRTDESEFHQQNLIQMPIRIVVSPSHPLTQKSRPSWSNLATYPWILPRLGTPVRTVIDNEFLGARISPPTPVIESTSTRLNYAIVRGTDTIGVMTEDAAKGYSQSGALTVLAMKLAGQLPYVGVLTRTKRVSNAVNTFLMVLRAECKSPALRSPAS